MLDAALVNAMTVSYINKGLAPSDAKADESFTEEWKLAMAPIKPHMAHCLDNPSKLSDYSQKSMMHFLGKRAGIYPQLDPQPQQSKKRCAMCLDEVRGKGYSTKRSKLSKAVHLCCKCKMPLCTKHKLKLCLSRIAT